MGCFAFPTEFPFDGLDAMSTQSASSTPPDINLTCPGCAAPLRVPTSLVNRQIQCPACGLTFAGHAAAQGHDSPPASRWLMSSKPSDTAPIDAAPSDAAPIDALPMDAEPIDNGPMDAAFADIGTIEATVVDTDTDEGQQGSAARAAFPETTPPAQRSLPPDRQWRLRTPEMIDYGPVSQATLERWVHEGRVTGECELKSEGDTLWRRADQLFPVLDERIPTTMATPFSTAATAANLAAANRSSVGRRAVNEQPSSAPASDSMWPIPVDSAAAPPIQASDFVDALAPHRGPLILAMGLIGLLTTCPLFSILAWVMGSNDLEEISRGRMDPTGRQLTKVGKTLGMWISIAWIISAAIVTIGLIYAATR